MLLYSTKGDMKQMDELIDWLHERWTIASFWASSL